MKHTSAFLLFFLTHLPIHVCISILFVTAVVFICLSLSLSSVVCRSVCLSVSLFSMDARLYITYLFLDIPISTYLPMSTYLHQHTYLSMSTYLPLSTYQHIPTSSVNPFSICSCTRLPLKVQLIVCLLKQ